MNGNSRVNRQQQVKVVIRLKPEQTQTKYSKCVYLSDQDQNQLVVETDNKKEIFMFDHVAHQSTTQQQIYSMIGQECVEQCFQGYNCCIFAYGQTGAGKTFSVLGNVNDLYSDLYCESRGILPRLLEDLFQQFNKQIGEKQTVTCSYMEIYNEQIFDLLSSDKRIHQIREDAKRGVFVEGLIQKKISSYKNAVGLLLEGEKTRKMASTLMNTESSRSHAIFTVEIQSQIIEEEVTKSKKAKLHIIDLAGSQRVKHTNVEGQRLREGCNINRSLHVLGNVINSLVQSSKKKKHIPFRDSKLTHYLKDSLGGNSITKLLANVHTGKLYFGDTLSTLMFAKRAKILKMKVELNQTHAQNFDALRKQVRRLRQELAQARYFKTEERMSERTTLQPQYEQTVQKITSDNVETDMSPKSEVLKSLQQNQHHFKALIEIYEEHMKTCLSSSNFQRKQNINIVKQWKNLEKRNISLTHLVKQLPSFTKIYKQNLLLRQQRTRVLDGLSSDESAVRPVIHTNKIEIFESNKVQLQKVVQFYENLLSEMESTFKQCLQVLEKNYNDLQSQCKVKQKKIKDLRKRKQYPPDIQELKNENQYLHLNILNLENEIAKMQQSQQRINLELKESKKNTARKVQSKQELEEEHDQANGIYDKLQEIRNQAMREAETNDIQRAEMQVIIQKMQTELNQYILENSKLKSQQRKSRSKRKTNQKKEQIQSLSNVEIKRSFLQTPAKELHCDDINFSARTANYENDQLKLIQQNYTKEILGLKMKVKRKQKEVSDVKKDLEHFVNGDKKIQQQFGKSLQQIIHQYRESNLKKTLEHTRSAKVIQKWKESDQSRPPSKAEQKEQKHVNIAKSHIPAKQQSNKLMKRGLNPLLK